MRTVTRLVAAAVLAGASASVAVAEPDPPQGGPCHVYWKPSTFDPGIPGVPNKGTPYVICDY